MSYRKFMEIANKAGLEVYYFHSSDPWSIDLWAPKGQVFNSSGCHVDSSLNQEARHGESRVPSYK